MIVIYKVFEVNLEKIFYFKILVMFQNYEKVIYIWIEYQFEDFCCCKIVQFDYYVYLKFDGVQKGLILFFCVYVY